MAYAMAPPKKATNGTANTEAAVSDGSMATANASSITRVSRLLRSIRL
jgi:hypothetical protein